MKRLVKYSLLCCRLFRRRTEGLAAVEFAILAGAFLLFIGGIMDFGHAWYIKQVVTNASREGARYGVMFRQDATAMQIKPSALSPSISSYVTNYLAKSPLPESANPTVTAAGTGYTNGKKGQPLEVTVTATKNWWIIATFVPGMGSSITLSSTTVMQCEGDL